MYFTKFPKINYLFKIGGIEQLRILRDITINVRFRTDVLSNISLYEYYSMKEYDTPEKVADMFYKNPNLHWIIMLANDRFKLSDFPMTNNQFEEYVNEKYGFNHLYDNHLIYGKPHYELPTGEIVDLGTELATPVSNWDYEFRLNEAKRIIRIISPKMVNQIANELESSVSI